MSARPGISFPWALTFLALITVATPPAKAAEVTLRWKFEPGQKLQYLMTQITSTGMQVQNQSIETKQEVKIDMTWNIDKVLPSGEAELLQTMTRIRMSVSQAGTTIDYDSAAEKPTEGPLVNLDKLMRSMLDKPFRITMSPTGEVKSVVIPPETLETLREAGPGAAALSNMFSEEGAKSMISQSMLTFPAEPIPVGHTWQLTSEMPAGPIGSMRIVREYTYTGPISEQEGAEGIDVSTTLNIVPPEDSPVELKLEKNDGKGRIVFDNAKGQVRSTSLDMSMKLQITAQGQQIDQTVNTQVNMELVPASN